MALIHKKIHNVSLIIIFLLSFSSCSDQKYQEDSVSKDAKDCNLIIITVDTLRNDYISSSGNYKLYTPNIDKLAKYGVQFFNTNCQIPYTVPSLSSIFTSSPPKIHGVITNNYSLRDTPYFLTKVLKNYGYFNQAIISGLAKVSTGLNQGFDGYKDNTSGNKKLSLREAKPLIGLEKNASSDIIPEGDEIFINAEICARNACEWLNENFSRKFFLWIHIWEPHQPYIPPKQYLRIYEDHYDREEYKYFHQFEKIRIKRTLLPLPVLNHVKNLYKAEVTYTDAQIGNIIKKITELGIKDKTLVIFTSDHGEELYEHQYFIGHGRFLYDPSMKIPLIFNHPDFKDQDFYQTVESIDISPSVLSFLNIPIPDKMMGRDLFPLINNRILQKKDFYIGETEGPKYSIWDGTWKLHKEKKRIPELYNITRDPGERVNLFKTNRKIGLALEKKLNKWIQDNSERPPEILLNQDPDMIQNLKALGYIN